MQPCWSRCVGVCTWLFFLLSIYVQSAVPKQGWLARHGRTPETPRRQPPGCRALAAPAGRSTEQAPALVNKCIVPTITSAATQQNPAVKKERFEPALPAEAGRVLQAARRPLLPGMVSSVAV